MGDSDGEGLPGRAVQIADRGRFRGETPVVFPRFFKDPRALTAAWLVLLALLHFFFGYFFAVDFIIACFLVVAAIFRRTRMFVWDWLPVFILFFVYQWARGAAYEWRFLDNPDRLAMLPVFAGEGTPRIDAVVSWEKTLFGMNGRLPGAVLQEALLGPPGARRWYDSTLIFAYLSFFWFPLAAGFFVWWRRPELHGSYFAGFFVLSFSACVFFAAMPMAPPWLASKLGFSDGIRRVLWDEVPILLEGKSLILRYVVDNPVAAFPSLHTGWEFYAAGFLARCGGVKFAAFFLFPLLCGFATVLYGEHYVVDVAAGAALAGLALAAAEFARFRRAGFLNPRAGL